MTDSKKRRRTVEVERGGAGPGKALARLTARDGGDRAGKKETSKKGSADGGVGKMDDGGGREP